MAHPLPRQRTGRQFDRGRAVPRSGSSRWTKIEIYSGPLPATARSGDLLVGLTGVAGGTGPRVAPPSTWTRPARIGDATGSGNGSSRGATGPGADRRTARGPAPAGLGALPWYHRTWLLTLTPLLLAVPLLVAWAVIVNVLAR